MVTFVVEGGKARPWTTLMCRDARSSHVRSLGQVEIHAVGHRVVCGGARIRAFVITADDEIVIARETVECLEGRG